MLKDVLEVHQFSDFINRDTNRPFTFQNWKDFVEKFLHEKKMHGHLVYPLPARGRT